MKKILLFILFVLNIFFYNLDIFAQECSVSQEEFETSMSVENALDKCSPDTLVNDGAGSNYKIDGGLQKKIISFTNTLMTYLSLIAIGAIVYGSLMMVLSQGDDEKIKKAKDIVKWSLIGFLGMITAGVIINLVVNFMFGLGK